MTRRPAHGVHHACPAVLTPPASPLALAPRASTWPVAVGFLAFLPAVLVEDYAYTWSLLAFVAPLVLMIDRVRRHDRAAWRELLAHGPTTLAVLLPMGLALNLVLADLLFVYPALRAVVGLRIPPLVGGPRGAVPIEEYLFYTLGFAFLLIGYVYFARRPASNRPLAPLAAHHLIAVTLGPAALTFGVARWLRPADSAGAPVYLHYLVSLPLLVTLVCAARGRRSLDRRALARITAFAVSLSVVWEAFLAIPRGWWGYNPIMMCGLDVRPGLPVEAVLVWLLAPVATAVVFEAFRASGLPGRPVTLAIGSIADTVPGPSPLAVLGRRPKHRRLPQGCRAASATVDPGVNRG